MKALGAFVAAAALVAAGIAGGYLVRGEDEPQTLTVTETERVTTTAEVEDPALPRAVDRKRLAILSAVRERDYDALAALIPTDGFTYTFGGPVEGGAVAYWRNLEQTTDERPFAALETVLALPYTLHRGLYVWPFAFDKRQADLTAYERGLLRPLGRGGVFVGGNYFGWRAGVEPDGDWVFFVAGD